MNEDAGETHALPANLRPQGGGQGCMAAGLKRAEEAVGVAVNATKVTITSSSRHSRRSSSSSSSRRSTSSTSSSGLNNSSTSYRGSRRSSSSINIINSGYPKEILAFWIGMRLFSLRPARTL